MSDVQLSKYPGLSSSKKFITYIIILCSTCDMPKYVPRLEGMMPDLEGSVLCLLTLVHFGILHGEHIIIIIIIITLKCPSMYECSAHKWSPGFM